MDYVFYMNFFPETLNKDIHCWRKGERCSSLLQVTNGTCTPLQVLAYLLIAHMIYHLRIVKDSLIHTVIKRWGGSPVWNTLNGVWNNIVLLMINDCPDGTLKLPQLAVHVS